MIVEYWKRRALLRVSFAVALFVASSAEAQWPTPAERSGVTLPAPRTISALLEISGIYVPHVENLSGGPTGVLDGTLTWNFRLVGGLGLFGEHAVSRMWWEDLSDTKISLLTFGHEVGARYMFGPHLVFEAAYLGHRIEYIWIDGNPWTVGGDHDHGAEVGLWGHIEPWSKVRFEGHLFGRKFAEPARDDTHAYTDQLVFGMGLRSHLRLFKRHSVVIELEALRVYRGNHRRMGVDEVTWNILGALFWRVGLGERYGVQLGARASTSWACGEIPMLEYKRSMIDEPMARLIVGFYFLI